MGRPTRRVCGRPVREDGTSIDYRDMGVTRGQEQLRQEVQALEVAAQAGGLEQALRSLDERGISQILVSNQYSGRYPLELLQNASDAASAQDGGAELVRFDVTERALLASNTGHGFTDDDVKAICSLGRTSKDPAKTIGYKGLGFKAVGEITDTPQILSGSHRFMFDALRANQLIGTIVGELPTGQRIPTYAFPFEVREEDLAADAALIAQLTEDGYTTTLRLPYRDGVEQLRVEQDVLTALDDKVLLLLPGIGELVIEGPTTLVKYKAEREQLEEYSLVTLRTSENQQSWFVFDCEVPVRQHVVVEALGDMWQDVDHLRATIAIPIEGREPAPGHEQPLRVFFPTEEHTGVPFVVHADFALELDRRHLGRTTAARRLNASLLQAVASLAESAVADTLASQAPESNRLISIFSPRRDPSANVGTDWTTPYVEAMRSTTFVRCVHGHMHPPDEVVMLPSSTPPVEVHELHQRFDLMGQHAVVPDAVGTAERAFLLTLGVHELSPAALLQLLQPVKGDEQRRLFEWLIQWEQNYPALYSALADSWCVPTIDGTWTRPSDGVLFAPDRKETPELPVGLPLAIAGLPEIEGLPGLFQRAGVKPWSWRDLLLEQVLPLLSEVDTPMEARAAAWKTVGFYLDAEGGGDQTLARRFGRVLLPARRPGEQNWELRRADSLYFGKDWTGSSRLEAIFGSFGRQEFLAFPAPSADPDELSRLRRLFRWMGVESRPRILEATADTASEYMFSALDRHPHRRAAAALWDRWLASTDFSSARFCDQGHAGSDRQQLAASFTLDRFPQLIEEGSPTAMGALFASLVEEWGAYYEARTTAEIRCQHKSHTGERTRPVTSLFKYMLRELAWLPAVHRGGPVLSRPSDVWLVADDTPSSVQSVLPLLDEGLDQPEAAALLRTIGVVDGGRPRPSELAEALRQARDSFERGLGDTSRSACDAARWLMRHLDDALRRYGAGLGSDAEVPLLAKLSGESIFHMKPYYCDDQAIVDAWGDELPILDADQKLTSLRDGLGLPNLADEVGTEIAYRSPVEQLTQSLERHLHDAKPFIAALALATSPSREPEILSRLPRLSVIACHELQLIHRRGGQTRTTSVGARLREEVIRGRYRRSVGTIFVDDELAEALDWWTVGPLVAQHLLVPAVDDAISILLGQSVTEKGRFLRSKGIDEKAVRRAAELLDVGQDREDDRLSVIRRSFLEDLSLAIQNAADGVPDASEGPSQHSQEASDRGIESEEADTKPWRFNPTPVNEVQITPEAITDATPGATLDEAQRGRLSSVGGSPKSRDTRPPPDSELLAIGTWGEELVFLAEQSRVAEMGFSPDVVIWVAKDNPMSPYDLESIDVDGQRVIIEVKSTTDADPLSPFPISLGELRAMIDAREHAYLYRVTRAGTRDASIVRFRDPIGWWEDERAQIDVAGASMRFSATADSSADVLGSSQPDS